MMRCQECEMPVGVGDYHPYEACVMFRAGLDAGWITKSLGRIRREGFRLGDEQRQATMRLWTCEWQPMETAPKDGSEVLLWDGNQCVAAKWDDISGGYHPVFAWAVGYLQGEGDWITEDDPIAWMPLPDPPKANEPGGGT